MSIEQKLLSIFNDIFSSESSFDPLRIREKYENWDSLANVTLLMAISEEFGDVIQLEDMELLDSYDKILKHLKENM